MQHLTEKINNAYSYIQQQVGDLKPEVGLVLGSGLGILADEIGNAVKIKYEDIPDFPVSTVEGHAGQFVIGDLEGKCVIAMQGRFHLYEGYSLDELTIPIRVMKKLGAEKLFLSNAAGGANLNFKPGDLMIISDHINFSFTNPLTGENLDEFGGRFPDMSNVYDREIISQVKDIASKNDIDLKEGVYFFSSGPCYETPSEVKMAQVLGADALGMSTVPEAIVGIHSGMKITGISCITNMASGILDQPLIHEEVMETTERVKDKFKKLVKAIINEI
ncbi:MAG: purine-nucleoside phosphorylase [Bacteroidetes bacterium]|nr:purine-nucleoside phosphorylase [Bacteroidia bacterium]PCH69763.1 MAG: purine-nucleoside phosphorylase [Bacteroidota bacterium]